MNDKGLTLCESLVIIVLVGILAFLFLPLGVGKIHRARVTACEANLRQLFRLGIDYSLMHQGEWPAATGSALWREFTRTTPPLIGPDQRQILSCPVKGGEASDGQCDYLGPSDPYRTLKPHSALGADKPHNHGEAAPVNVLLKDGSVQEYGDDYPSWKTLSE